MKREEIKTIFPEATDEQLNSIMKINGADVEREKGKLAELNSELKNKTEAFDTLSAEIETLKKNNATADDYKQKFEELTKSIADKEAEAEAQKAEAEKNKAIAERFSAVVGEKKFAHSAIEASYAKAFREAVESADNAGKSDKDIFHELTKDDSGAFKGVERLSLAGGELDGNNKEVHTIPRIF